MTKVEGSNLPLRTDDDLEDRPFTSVSQVAHTGRKRIMRVDVHHSVEKSREKGES